MCVCVLRAAFHSVCVCVPQAAAAAEPVLRKLFLFHPYYPTILLQLSSTTDTVLTATGETRPTRSLTNQRVSVGHMTRLIHQCVCVQ